jgi:uncharacterized membrane protein
MTAKNQATFACSICGKSRPASQAVHGAMIHGGVLERIHARRPEWPADGLICTACLRDFRAEYVSDVLERERGELTALEEGVLESLREHETVAADLNMEFDRDLSLGERLADRMASFGGSWTFLITFGMVLAGWITFNVVAASKEVFDPYPFILLNLVLSCLAAIQAPVIMMSQNRQESKDRLRAENDYRVNLKAELEIRHLHTKLDQLLTRQWQRLLEIQRIQTELLEELGRGRR